MAFMAVIMCLGLLFYILLGFGLGYLFEGRFGGSLEIYGDMYSSGFRVLGFRGKRLWGVSDLGVVDLEGRI